MKKFILIVFLCLTLCVCIVACDVKDENSDGSQTEETISEFENNELISELVEYLKQIRIAYEPLESHMEIKIDRMKRGNQSLHVSFDPSSYYFVCGYFNFEHYEGDYCCVEQYTWMKFDDEADIREYCNGKEFIVAFQINRASSVIDIESGDSVVPAMEHFQLYHPLEFENGYNTKGALVYDASYVYINFYDSDKGVIYHSRSWMYHDYITFNTVKIDNEFYIATRMYTISSDGARNDANLLSEFGIYYDALFEIMDTDNYSAVDKYGRTAFYGLFDIEEFVGVIMK